MQSITVTVAPYSTKWPTKPTKKALREAARLQDTLDNGEFYCHGLRRGYATIRELVGAGIEMLEVRSADLTRLVAVITIGVDTDGTVKAVVS